MKAIVFAIALLISSVCFAQIDPIDKNGLAIGGYDVVAYFSNTATKGSAKYAIQHEEATYHFSSKENQQKFKKDPAKYLPQFGGYCAWGVAEKSSKFPINPETFDVVDGKLYLFFNGPFKGSTFNSLDPWSAQTTKLTRAAHENWTAVKEK